MVRRIFDQEIQALLAESFFFEIDQAVLIRGGEQFVNQFIVFY